MEARLIGNPWGTWHARPRGHGTLEAAAAAFLALLVASPLTLGAVRGEEPAARLVISEILVDPAGEVPEAEGEWFELLVVESGSLAGIVLTDSDGPADFVFAGGRAQAGEILVVANGRTPPEGVDTHARLFFAGKSWWTFDNGGDDLSVLSPGGELQDFFAWGEGDSVDAPGGGLALAPAQLDAVPGASVGRIESGSALLIPTPGSANRAATLAQDVDLTLFGALVASSVRGILLCSQAGDFDSFLWRIATERGAMVLPRFVLRPTACAYVGERVGPSYLDAIQGISADRLVSAPFAERFPQESANGSSLVDPAGAAALSWTIPLSAGAESPYEAVLLRPCGCASMWKSAPLSPGPSLGPMRNAQEVELVESGPMLGALIEEVAANASYTLEVNAYVLTLRTFEEALAGASSRGVAVRLLAEGSPAGLARNETVLEPGRIAALATAGVWVREFVTERPAPARDHAKYIIADGTVSVVQTENFVYAAVAQEGTNTGYAVKIRSREFAADLGRIFDWDFINGADLAYPVDPPVSSRPEGTFEGQSLPAGNASVALLYSPGADAPLDAWVDLVENAQETFSLEVLSADLATLGPSSPLGRALLDAVSRGVSAKILLSSSYADPAAEDGNFAVARAFGAAEKSGRLEVRLDAAPGTSNSILHAKAAVADRTRLIVGSHNLVATAFRANREVSVLIEDRAAGSVLADFLEAHFESSIPIRADEVRLESGSTFGATPPADVVLLDRPPSFELAFLAGASVTLVGHLVGRRKRAGRGSWLRTLRRGMRRDHARTAVSPSTQEALWIRLPDVTGIEKPELESPRPSEPERARDKTAAPTPPTAFDLFGER